MKTSQSQNPYVLFIGTLVLISLGFVTWAFGQEDEEPVEYSSTSSAVIESPTPYPDFKANVGVQSFQNQVRRMTGYSYLGTAGLFYPKKYFVYAQLPFLYGQVRGKEYQELGNPKLGLEGFLAQLSAMELWIEGSGRFSLPGSVMASRYDSYRMGAELRIDRSTYFSHMGAGYTFRTNEQDRRVDMGDITDFEISIGRRIFRNWTGYTKLMWFRSQNEKFNDIVIARDAEWAGLQPGIRYRLVGGLELGIAAIFSDFAES